MKDEPIQGFNNEYSRNGEDCPRCSKCGICLDSDYAMCYADHQMADICGKCVLRYIDPNEEAETKCARAYVDKRMVEHE